MRAADITEILNGNLCKRLLKALTRINLLGRQHILASKHPHMHTYADICKHINIHTHTCT